MKKISTASDASASTTPRVTERYGTKVDSSTERTVRSTSRQYTNVAMNVPRVNCTRRSLVKLRNTRGP